MIRVLIIDDEALARQRVRKLLNEREDVEIIQECRNGKEAIDAILREKPDLIFLDIQMKDMTGFDVLRAMPQDKWPLTIFVTAYDEYAIQAFDIFAFDYLLKPFKNDRFYLSLDKAIGTLQQKQQGERAGQLKELVDYLQKQQTKDNIRRQNVSMNGLLESVCALDRIGAHFLLLCRIPAPPR